MIIKEGQNVEKRINSKRDEVKEQEESKAEWRG